MKHARKTTAVSQILSEIILLGIAVVSVSIIYSQVVGILQPPITSNVTILGKIEDHHPVFDIQRGESLSPFTKIILSINGITHSFLLNNEWTIGERIICPDNVTTTDITKRPQVEATIIDTKTNSIVFWGVLQQGLATGFKGGIWHFNEVTEWNGTLDEVKDSSGNTNHGTAQGKPNITMGMSQNARFFNGYDDTVKVPASWSLDITDSITVAAWMKPTSPKSQADILKIQENFGYTPYITHVTGDCYAIISQDKASGEGTVCRLSTVNISTAGEITPDQDVYFGNSTSKKTLRPMITQISEEIYLVSFNDKDGYLHLRTFDILNNGSIHYTGHETVCRDYAVANDPGRPNRPSQRQISENVCAVAYWGKLNQQQDIGHLKTLRVSSQGEITYIENITYLSGAWYEPYLIHVVGDVYGLAFRNVSNYGLIKTFHINATGHITPIDEKVYSASAYQPCLINVSGNISVFALAYRDSDSYGYVKIINISSSGIITLTNKWKTFEQTAGDCFNPCIFQVSDDHYVIAYSTGDNTGVSFGYVVTLVLLKNGSIGSIDQRKEFEIPEKISSQTRCFNPVLLRVSPFVFAITYEGFGDHPGKLLTLLIGKDIRGIYKDDSFMVYANMTMIVGRINDVMISAPNPNPLVWHHIALTYDGTKIQLYIDGEGDENNSVHYNHHWVNSSTTDLYFGRFYCGLIDEIGIYDKALTPEQIRDQFNNPGTLEQYLR